MFRSAAPLALILLVALAGCQQQRQAHDARAQAEERDKALADAAARATRIPCALGGAVGFQGVCTVERTISGDGLTLVMHHPDGGFRRLLVTTDGRGVVTADGFEPAVVTVVDPGTIEVRVEDDRYRLPATVKGQSIPQRQ